MKIVKLLSIGLAICIAITYCSEDGVCQQKKKKAQKSQPPKSSMPTELKSPISPKISEALLPKGDTFIIETENGDVAVRNFFKGREKDATVSGIELVCIDGDGRCDYSIYFNWNWKSFAIMLQKAPVPEVREQAEQSFLQQLNISREDACRLNVHLNVLNGIDEKYDGGEDYGLSFCPNGIPFDPNQWTELNRGQKKGVFQFSPDRTLLYSGHPVVGVRFRPTVQKIAISPPAASGKYAISVTFDDIESAAFLLRLNNHTGKQLMLQGPPLGWVAWSPSGTHAVIGSYYEADETLYSINLPSGVARKFSFNVARQTEEEIYDLDKLTWIDDKVFRLRVTVNCNPYTDDNCSDQDRKKVLREYEVRADVTTLAMFSERIR
jgi:hypothetical protein